MKDSEKTLYKRLKNRLAAWSNKVLNGTLNHFFCFFPEKTGILSNYMLKIFFSGIKLSDDQLNKLNSIPKNAITVYATKNRSCFERYFYYTRYRGKGILCPEIGFGYRVFMWQPVSRIIKIIIARIDSLLNVKTLPAPCKSGYIKQELLNGRAAIFSLVEKKGFYHKFIKSYDDPILFLIEMQKTIDRPIYIIPNLMFFSKKPHRKDPSMIDIVLGSEENPKKIRKLVALLNHSGKIFVEIAEPVNVRDFIKLDENIELTNKQMAFALRRWLLVDINSHRQSITGPVLKSVDELKQSIITSERLQKYMDSYAKNRNISLRHASLKAGAHIEEIASTINPGAIKIFAAMVKWLINTIFDGVTVNYDVLNKVKADSKKGPVIFIPCHKSHIDYLLVSFLLYQNNMPCPHIAAGKNLSFWPMGPIFRKTGAFFVRRTFKGAVLYAKVFSEYIHKLVEEGFNIELFIEGGRSRTGKLLRPQLGLLSLILNACRNGACEDMIFVPLYIGYDRVLEEKSYIHEIEGGQKKPENLRQVLKARRFLKKRYGRIYVRFNDPVSLKELVAQQNRASLKEMNLKEQNLLCRNLGDRMINAIDSMTVVTPHALVASALLNCFKKSFSYDHLMLHVETFMSYLKSQKVKLADTLLVDYGHAVHQVIESYVNGKFIEISHKNNLKGTEKRLEKAYFKVNENKRAALEYYKNNSIAIFIHPAFTALAILERDSFQFAATDLHSGYSFLQEFFKNEFMPNIERTSEYFVRKSIKAFIDDAIIVPHSTLPDTYNITSIGLRKLKQFSRFLKTYFESYLVVLSFFDRYANKKMNAKDRLKKIQSLGNRMYKNRTIELKESLSKVNYENAVDYFISHRIKGASGQEKIDFYYNFIQKYLNHLYR